VGDGGVPEKVTRPSSSPDNRWGLAVAVATYTYATVSAVTTPDQLALPTTTDHDVFNIYMEHPPYRAGALTPLV
jgi:hypothetical protein